MGRNGILLAAVAILAFAAGMLMAGGPLHAHHDEVTALGSFSKVSGSRRDGSRVGLTVGWVVRDGEVYRCRRENYPETPFTCKKHQLVFE